MNRPYEMLRDAIREMSPKITATVRALSQIPTEHSIAEIVELLASAMEDGYPTTAAQPVMVGGEVQAFQCCICEKTQPGQQMRVTIIITVHADPDDPLGPTDSQAVIAAIIAISAHVFAGRAKKAKAEPPSEKIEKFPVQATAPDVR